MLVRLPQTGIEFTDDLLWMVLVALYQCVTFEQLHRIRAELAARKDVRIERAIGGLFVDVLDPNRRSTTVRNNGTDGERGCPTGQ